MILLIAAQNADWLMSIYLLEISFKIRCLYSTAKCKKAFKIYAQIIEHWLASVPVLSQNWFWNGEPLQNNKWICDLLIYFAIWYANQPSFNKIENEIGSTMRTTDDWMKP